MFFSTEKSNKARAYGDAILDASGLALIINLQFINSILINAVARSLAQTLLEHELQFVLILVI
jgi:hypothetical protein